MIRKITRRGFASTKERVKLVLLKIISFDFVLRSKKGIQKVIISPELVHNYIHCHIICYEDIRNITHDSACDGST
jgi:hypothetical protein